MAVELATFLGLAMLLEGVAMALFPGGSRRMLDQVASLTAAQLRIIGLSLAVVAALALMILAHFASDPDGMSFAFPETRRFVAGLI